MLSTLDQQPPFDGKRQRLPVERTPFLSQGILPHRLDLIKEMTVGALSVYLFFRSEEKINVEK